MERRAQFNLAYLLPPDLAERLSKYDVKYTRVYESTFLRDLLSWILPALIFFGVWYLLARRMASSQGLGGGVMSIGKRRAKKPPPSPCELAMRRARRYQTPK